MKEEQEITEGYVVRFRSGLRLKIKKNEYVRLHRLVTGVNTRRVWEVLSNGESLTPYLDRVPDEFYNFVKKTQDDLKEKFESIKLFHESAVLEAVEEKGITSRKELAEVFKKLPIPGLAFAILGKKKTDHIVWRNIKPPAERPFRIEV